MQIRKILLSKAFGCLLIATLLFGCSPTFDWRIVRSDDLFFEAMYPAKPSRAEKSFVVDGKQLVMTMEAARAADALYAVGTISLSSTEATAINISLLMKFLENGMLSNLGALNARPEIVTVRTAGQPSYELAAKQWHVSGIGPDGAQRILKFRLIQRQLSDGRMMVYQVGVLQTETKDALKKTELLNEQHQTFLNGFRPY